MIEIRPPIDVGDVVALEPINVVRLLRIGEDDQLVIVGFKVFVFDRIAGIERWQMFFGTRIEGEIQPWQQMGKRNERD